MTFRFVHAADIHLDSPLRSLALRDADLAELIGTATRQAFVRIIDLCLAEQVDALLLAGDLYDGEQTSMKTARFLADQLRRLDEAGIRTFIIRGNHDAMSRITRELTLPPSVKVFDGHAEAVAVGTAETDRDVLIHGLSFTKPQAPESLLPLYKSPQADAINIGMLHTSLTGAAGHDPYAPCSLADLQAHGFDYWALGHVHKRSVVQGTCTVVMPGNPQGRDINEDGIRSVTLATIEDDRSVLVEERMSCIAQFERVAVDLGPIADWREMLDAVDATLRQTRAAATAEHLVVRLRLSGATPLAWRLRRDPDLLKTEVDARASVIGNCWVELVEVDSEAPRAGATTSADPMVELRRLIDERVLAAPAFRAELSDIAAELARQLPPEARGMLGGDEAAAAEILAELALTGADDVLARLAADGDGG